MLNFYEQALYAMPIGSLPGNRVKGPSMPMAMNFMVCAAMQRWSAIL